MDPGPDVPDPSPINGQIGEGDSLRSGESIARLADEISNPDDESSATPTRGDAFESASRTPGSAEGERDRDEQSR